VRYIGEFDMCVGLRIGTKVTCEIYAYEKVRNRVRKIIGKRVIHEKDVYHVLYRLRPGRWVHNSYVNKILTKKDIKTLCDCLKKED
jgi:hypothetical protein